MNRIAIGGAGGAPSEGVIFSLLKNPNFEVIGLGADTTDLICSKAPEKYLVPYAHDEEYAEKLIATLRFVRPDFIHFQNDLEIFAASGLRNEFDKLGIKYFFPSHEVVDRCVHKYKSYLAFKNAGVKVPKNILISSEQDLKDAFSELGSLNGKIWLRTGLIGGGGKGSLATDKFDFARNWIEVNSGWGNFLAAELLTSKTVTWQSIWYQGRLVAAQTRRRSGWIHGNRTMSGVTGVTKVGITMSDSLVDEIAVSSVMAVDKKPHGLFGVDLTYDHQGVPNPTEINIARFFTTIRFFTEAGFNMPDLYVNIGLGKINAAESKVLNPLKNGLCWLRGMDREPILIEENELNSLDWK